MEALRRLKALAQVRLLLVQQFRDKVVLIIIGEGEAQLELLHQVEEEAVRVLRILDRVHDVPYVCRPELTLLPCQEWRVEEGVDAVGTIAGSLYASPPRTSL
jgi:hypothetical protein